MQISSNHSRLVSTTMCLIPYLKQPGMQSWNTGRQSLHRYHRGQGPWNSAITCHPRLCAHTWNLFSLPRLSVFDVRSGPCVEDDNSVSQGRELPCMESRPGCTPQSVHGKQAKGGPRCECVSQFSLCCKEAHDTAGSTQASILPTLGKGKCYH